ncbi:MAG: hypothetical protein MH825_05355 [Cyanobacteria bacterium]|nr:hypothetical protein [Cyanobacteriota bacterium]
MPPAYVGTRVFIGLVTYLVMMQILKPLIEECPFGSCLFPPISISIGDAACPPTTPSCKPANTCLSYEYAPCNSH